MAVTGLVLRLCGLELLSGALIFRIRMMVIEGSEGMRVGIQGRNTRNYSMR